MDIMEERKEDIRLRNILMQSYQEVDFYLTQNPLSEKQMNSLQLSDFPLLDRQTIQQQHRLFLNDRYRRYPNIESLLVEHSFGVSGIPLEVYWDRRDASRAQDALWTFREELADVTVNEKCCVFCTAEYAGNKIMDYMPKRLSWDKKILSFSMRELSLKRLKGCLDDISTFDPVWMCLSPSTALMLAKTMELFGRLLLPSLRYIELSGEMLDEQTESVIRNAFHVQIANVYATKEAGPVAASCAHGDMHIFSANAVVEVIRDGKPVMDEEGDIYITSLQNNAMPIIRLKTGDRGILQSTHCSFEREAPVLRLTRGRECGFIITTSGRKISALVLRSMAEYANEEVSRCLSYIRFRQNDYASMEVVLGVKPAFWGWEEEIARVFCRQISDSELERMKWNFIFVKPDSAETVQMEEKPFFEVCGEVE